MKTGSTSHSQTSLLVLDRHCIDSNTVALISLWVVVIINQITLATTAKSVIKAKAVAYIEY